MTESLSQCEHHVEVESDDANAAQMLHDVSGLSKQRIKDAMTKGAVWVTRGRRTQRLRRASRALRVGDTLHVYYDAAVLSEVPQPPQLVADLGAYTVWNKPYGVRSQGSKWGDHCTVARWAEQHFTPQRTAFTVHRLDRAANGLMLVAHSKKTAAALAELFRERRIEKRYRALVAGDFSAQPTPLRVTDPLDDKTAVSEITLQQVVDDGRRSQVDVRIETGRKHQIRRHLAALGHPVIGDRLYGAGKMDGADLQLTACLLAFVCPVSGEPVEFRL